MPNEVNRPLTAMSTDILFHTIFPHETSQTWVVFVHGAGGSSAIWFRQLKAYKKEYMYCCLIFVVTVNQIT